MTVEECLPAELRGSAITRIAAGLSGAAVYRVEADGRAFVLKVAGADEDAGDWRRALDFQRLAAGAGLAPAVVHVDERRRAVLTPFVVDRSFGALYRDPRTHAAAVAQLGRTVRRIHALPLPAGGPLRDARAFLVRLRDRVGPAFLPPFAREVVERALAAEPPAGDAPPVLAHNDLNPSNLIHDGQAILVLDWASAGPNDPFFDLGVVAVFLRMDQATSLALLSAYHDAPSTALPDRFVHQRRLAGALAATAQLVLAHTLGHAGATGSETLASSLPLGDFYQRMVSGAVALGTPDGHWEFGLALLRESLAL